MKRKASIKFLSRSEGGRTSPPMTGYRPQIKVGEESTCCYITSANSEKETMDFGIFHNVYIELQFEKWFLDEFVKTVDIELYEGNRLVGVGHFVDW